MARGRQKPKPEKQYGHQTVSVLVEMDGVQYTNDTAIETLTNLMDLRNVNYKSISLVEEPEVEPEPEPEVPE